MRGISNIFPNRKRLILEDRTVKLLSEAESLMPERTQSINKFIEMIIGLNEESVESVFRQIDEDNVKKVCGLIRFSIEIRPLEVDSFLTLVSLISSKFKVNFLSKDSYFPHSLLEQRGTLPHNGIFKKLATRSIEQVIREDNVEQFCNLISDPSFNAKSKVNLGPIDKRSFLMFERRSYMQLIAYFGAVKCFRQAIMNDDFDLNYISKYAIAGGNNEIVRILEQKGISFDSCFDVAVKYHRMDLCDWLLMHTKCESISLSTSMQYFNYPSFFFTMINEKSFNDALSIAMEKRNIDVIKYLFEQHRVDTKTISIKAIINAAREGDVDFIKFLIEQCHVDVNIKYVIRSVAPLNIAAEKCHLNVVKYLIEQCNADIKTISSKAIINATEKEDIDLIKYLIEKCHADVNVKDRKGNSLLHIAVEKCNIDIVKYLFEQCHADVKTLSSRTIIDATSKGDIEFVEYLYGQLYNNGWTPLHLATIKGKIADVKHHIEQCHADVEAKNNDGWTPLHFASSDGHIEVVKYLIEQCQANVEAKDNDELTSLHHNMDS
jgi:ankyrin repeat protein